MNGESAPCVGSVGWQERTDAEAVWTCRLRCPRRQWCAREAWQTPHAYGLYAGVVIPAADGRPRAHALRSIAAIAGIAPQRAAERMLTITARHGARRAP